MADPAFRETQWEQRYASHIAPINRYVDKLRETEWAPYVAPIHGGTNARILSLLRDPGPKTKDESGSGFLCLENDDQTAERLGTLLHAVGLRVGDVLPWNAYPWYINRRPKSSELARGAQVILDVLEMHPALRVVLLQGESAKEVWSRLLRKYPAIEHERGLRVFATYHPSKQALWHADPEVRASRLAHQEATFSMVAQVLAGDPA